MNYHLRTGYKKRLEVLVILLLVTSHSLQSLVTGECEYFS